MAYAASARNALEKLRRKLLGADATVELLKLGAKNAPETLATVTTHFFLGRETDLAKGEEYLKLEMYPTPELAAQMSSVVAVRYKGLIYGKTVAELPLDAAGIYTLRLDPRGKS